jgi:hypothetical protein
VEEKIVKAYANVGVPVNVIVADMGVKRWPAGDTYVRPVGIKKAGRGVGVTLAEAAPALFTGVREGVGVPELLVVATRSDVNDIALSGR